MLQLLTSAIAQMHDEFLGAAPAGAATFPEWMGVPMAVLIMAGIAYCYKGHGLKGLSILMTYITALIVVQLSSKKVLKPFPYPMFLSLLHFIFTLTAVTILIEVTGEQNPSANFQCPKFQKWFLRAMLPTAICTFLAITMNNVSLVYIGAGINAMIGLATPVVTAMVAALFGLRIAALAWVGVLLTVGGDAIITLEGFNVSSKEGQSTFLFMYGVFLAVFAMGSRGAKTVLQDRLMNNYGNEGEELQNKLTPLQTWFFQGPLLIVFGTLGTALKEGLAPWQTLPTALSSFTVVLMIANVACAVLLNISAMYCIKLLGAPAAQIAGKLNVLVVAALSSAILGETLTLQQGLSTVFIIAGAGLFEKAQKAKTEDLKGLLEAFQGEKYDGTAEKC